MTANAKSGVPDEWSEAQRDLYGKVFRFMLQNQSIFSHPDATPIDPEHWNTIAHNPATCAADLSEGNITISDDDGRVLATSEESETLQ